VVLKLYAFLIRHSLNVSPTEEHLRYILVVHGSLPMLTYRASVRRKSNVDTFARASLSRLSNHSSVFRGSLWILAVGAWLIHDASREM